MDNLANALAWLRSNRWAALALIGVILVLGILFAPGKAEARSQHFERIYPNQWNLIGSGPCGIRIGDMPFVTYEYGRKWWLLATSDRRYQAITSIRPGQRAWIWFEGHTSTQILYPNDC